ncbi:MAG: dihydroorotate dehydrogenase [Chloroflexi bacterium]|nr:MAG: dihydroorotate dehydrogenase [Chloroflexota bacterium]
MLFSPAGSHTLSSVPNLTVELLPGHKRGLFLSNPVLTASGTFGNGLEYAKVFDIQLLGAIVSKAITLRPRRGNAQPRIVETAAGMLNSIGLQNIGIEAILRDVAPLWATWRVPVIANIAGESIAHYAELARRLDGTPGVSGIEVNVSCPNVENGLEFGTDPKAASALTYAVRRETDMPLLVKLGPNVTDIVDIAAAVANSGADALTLINTFPAMRIDIQTRRPALGWGSGGLSGPALKPIALRMVYQVARSLDIPIVGCGGIVSAEDTIEFLMAGARAVQVGTATFRNPRAPLDIIEELEDLMRRQGVDDLQGIVGAALPARRESETVDAAASERLRQRL